MSNNDENIFQFTKDEISNVRGFWFSIGLIFGFICMLIVLWRI